MVVIFKNFMIQNLNLGGCLFYLFPVSLPLAFCFQVKEGTTHTPPHPLKLQFCRLK